MTTTTLQERLHEACRTGYEELIEFVSTDAFEGVYDELMSLEPANRPQFVVEVLLSDDELAKRGVCRPEDLLIQRSTFGDRRPTLFCVKKWLPPEFHRFWENVNITFDNDEDVATVPTDERAWRAPLPPALQQQVLKGALDDDALEEVIRTINEPSGSTSTG